MVQGGRRHRRPRRAAVRGVDRQGRLRGPVARRRRPDGDPRRGGGHRRRGRGPGRHRRRRRRRRSAPPPRRPPGRRRRAGAGPRRRHRRPPHRRPRRRARARRLAAPRRRPVPPATRGRAGRPGPSAAPAPAAPAAAGAPDVPAGADQARVLSPVVRRLLADHDIDPSTIRGTGLEGRITRADVEAVIERGGPPAAVPSIGGGRAPPGGPVGRPAPAPARPRRRRPRATACVPGDGTRWCRSPTSVGARPSTWSARRRRRPTH